ncbi:MAG: hypothetical protein RI958_939 [Actinomycetota bacterium]|jgi:hypothetical protein
MDVTASLDAPCSPSALFALVEALDEYPAWMPLTHQVDSDGSDEGRLAWKVELRARLGPFARSKRLRMVRTVHDRAGHHVRFERVERDGREHSPWVLDAVVVPVDAGCRLEMHLHYGGALWTGGVMERVLGEQIVAGRAQLLAMANASD